MPDCELEPNRHHEATIFLDGDEQAAEPRLDFHHQVERGREGHGSRVATEKDEIDAYVGQSGFCEAGPVYVLGRQEVECLN